MIWWTQGLEIFCGVVHMLSQLVLDTRYSGLGSYSVFFVLSFLMLDYLVA